MYSQRSFIPGSRTNTSRVINYIANYNNSNNPNKQLNCLCIPDKYDKSTPSSSNPSIKTSSAMKTAYIIKNTKGGKLYYGNSYLNQPLELNYLGKREGMSGGSGRPPYNKF